MAKKHTTPGTAALRKLEASLHLHWLTHKARSVRTPVPMIVALWRRIYPILRRRLVRRSLIALSAAAVVFVVILGALWWRLASGPIELDLATPWLTAAIEENFGGNYTVEVGGTQLERDRSGHIRLRLRDIVVRDAEGAIAASAPKAEVGFSGRGLIAGNMRAQRLSLVGAELAVRIEPDGKIAVFAGADKHPIATASATVSEFSPQAGRAPDARNESSDAATAGAPPNPIENLTALLAWIDSLGASGLDGHDLTELGLKNGNLVVDDQRNGQRWRFENINLGLMRSEEGGVVFIVESESAVHPWSLSAAVAPGTLGRRSFIVEARRVLAKDLLLALRVGEGAVVTKFPISASLRAEIGQGGAMQGLQGRIIVEGGTVADLNDPDLAISIDRAEFSLDWDAARRRLIVPFQIISGGNRMTLFAQIEPPQAKDGIWKMGMTGGTVVLGAGQRQEDPVVFNRILVRARIDPARGLVTLEQGDLANVDTGVALTGSFDFSDSDPRLAIGVAGTHMTLSTMKKLWPSFANRELWQWVQDHTSSGTVERVVIATNAPLSKLKRGGPPIPEDGLSVDIVARDTTIQPIAALPEIRGANLIVRATGQTATVSLARGTVELPSGRKLTLLDGVFEVPKIHGPEPPSRTRFRLEGLVPAAAELLAMDRLRQFSSLPFDPATARGTLTAQVTLDFPLKADLPVGSAAYSITADIDDFAADQVFLAQKVEAGNIRIAATNQGYQIKGDVKIAGAPAAVNYRKSHAETYAEVHIQTTLDEKARERLGFNLGNALVGPVPLNLNGQVAATDRESRFNVELDLTQAHIDNLMPGWTKPAGKTARANFTWVSKARSVRLDNLTIEGAGTQVKGSLEIDNSGEIAAAHFPVFSLAEGDKANFKADRAADGTLRVTMRGDIYDGRGFVKSSMSGSRPDGKSPDLDLDVKLNTVIGFNGETLRAVELKLSRRGGKMRNFALNAKLGRDAALVGDLRNRANGRQVVYFETRDAGTLFRFTDTYARMVGGQMWVAMDAPTATPTPQEGLLSIRDFTIRGEAALESIVSGAPNAQRDGVKFSRMRAEFTRNPGRLEIREGVVQGIVGATIDGHINYEADQVHLRGSFVPLYQLNNMFGQLPIVGFFLGGSNEGLLGVTYEVVGPPNAPRLNVNPLSAVAPGLLRKFFEFRNTDRGFDTIP
ncbi:MAG: DUF3971 domain-containing protein [Xanthobacteraceae bacterium]